jgi:cellulose synthase/poly-beta-1,6-N-acetylglucosamine synthase-like glycosyltransferase
MATDKIPVHCLITNPADWIRASLLKFKTATRDILTQTSLAPEELQAKPWSQRHAYLHHYARLSQEKRWQDTTGIAPGVSHFTLIVPIHNEESSLPSFLSTLMLADIPATVDMNIIFITNACNDSSNLIISGFLASLGEVEIKPLRGEFSDHLLCAFCKTVKLGGITFMHVDTETPGKGYALHTGNTIARASGHLIAICIDANDYIEPDAIRVMFAAAHRAFRSQPGIHDTVILSGTDHAVRRTSRLKLAVDKIESSRQHLIADTSCYILGCLMAWNTEWLHSIGNPLGTALEDYAMGVLARTNNYCIGRVEEAIIWSYGVNTFKDLLETRARFVRGMLQLLASVHDAPSIVKIVEQDAFYMRKFRARLQHVLQRAKQHPQNFPKYLATFLLWEYAVARGKRDFALNPGSPTWKKIASTR